MAITAVITLRYVNFFLHSTVRTRRIKFLMLLLMSNKCHDIGDDIVLPNITILNISQLSQIQEALELTSNDEAH